MTASSFSAFAMALSIGLNLVALYVFVRTRRRPKANTGERRILLAGMPGEAVIPDPAADGLIPSANPLVEAEVFLIYGRQEDAARVLKAALREGRIGDEDLHRFWARHGAAALP